MNCYFHSDVPAVSVCSVCGVGLCPQCVDTSVHFVEGQNICRRCAPAKLEAANAAAKRDRGRFLWRYRFALGVFLLFVGACFILPVVVGTLNLDKYETIKETMVTLMMVSVTLLGLTGPLLLLRRPVTETQQICETIWLTHNPQAGCLMAAIILVVGMFLSFIIVPWYSYSMRRNVKKCDTIIQQNDALLAQLATINASQQA